MNAKNREIADNTPVASKRVKQLVAVTPIIAAIGVHSALRRLAIIRFRYTNGHDPVVS